MYTPFIPKLVWSVYKAFSLYDVIKCHYFRESAKLASVLFKYASIYFTVLMNYHTGNACLLYILQCGHSSAAQIIISPIHVIYLNSIRVMKNTLTLRGELLIVLNRGVKNIIIIRFNLTFHWLIRPLMLETINWTFTELDSRAGSQFSFGQPSLGLHYKKTNASLQT